MHHTEAVDTTARTLRPVTDGAAHTASEPDPARARAKPALAVWRLARTSRRPLPSELARQLITHYSEPGDLIVAAAGAKGALTQAKRLGRRATTLKTHRRTTREPAATAAVIALRTNERANLGMAVVTARAVTCGVSELAAHIRELLQPGAFLVLALNHAHGPLGAIVLACQRQGLQYWQHIVALDPDRLEHTGPETEPASEHARALRCHRDLLIFRRPAHADALAGEAAAVADAAA